MIVPRKGGQAIERPGGDTDLDALVAGTAVDTLVGRHVGEVPAHRRLHEMPADGAAVGGIESRPADIGQPDLTPGMALRLLVLTVDVAADIAGGNAVRPQHGDHQVGKILADSLASRQQMLDGRSGIGHIACILETSADVLGDLADPHADPHSRHRPQFCQHRVQERRGSCWPPERQIVDRFERQEPVVTGGIS